MLGFGALGEFALGEGPTETDKFAGGSGGTQQRIKGGISAALIATTGIGFVPPPQPTIGRVFAQFSQPRELHISAAQVAGPVFEIRRAESPRPVFSTFTHQRPRLRLRTEDQFSGLFDSPEPIAVPFTGFCNFSQPRQIRFNHAAQLASVEFSLFVEIARGGTSRRLPGKFGFEPVKKDWTRPKPVNEPPKVWTPPRTRVADVPAARPAPELIDKHELPDIERTMQAMRDAEDISDVARHLTQAEQDAQDAEDIADILAMLDAQKDVT